MENLMVTVLIGVLAGTIDIIPMLIQKLDRYSILSAFFQWIIVVFVIANIKFGPEGWAKGLIVALMMAIPILILVAEKDRKSVIPILLMNIILGSLAGIIVDKFVK